VVATLEQVLKLPEAGVVEDRLRARLPGIASKDMDQNISEAKKEFALGSAGLSELRRISPSKDDHRRELAVDARLHFEAGFKLLEATPSKLDEIQKVIAAAAKKPSTSSATSPAEAEANAKAKGEAVAAHLMAPVQETAHQKFDSIVGDAGIFDDIAASAVVTAPDRFWRGVFNEAYGSGNGGNADIAIKMVSLGDFSLKGVRLDATKVTPAVFQGITQAVTIAAAASGVPVGAVHAAGQSATQPAVGDDLLEADRSKAEARGKLQDARIAALRVFRAIDDRRAAIIAPEPGGDAGNAVKQARLDAVKQIKATYGDARDTIQVSQ
jgi:hypothetical protein